MSEQKRYTAQDYRQMVVNLENNLHHGMERVVIASPRLIEMVRQAAETEDENAQLKARLEAVVNMLSNVYHDCRYSNAVSMFKEEYDAILRAARGETSRNGNNSGSSSENRNVKGSDNGK